MGASSVWTSGLLLLPLLLLLVAGDQGPPAGKRPWPLSSTPSSIPTPSKSPDLNLDGAEAPMAEPATPSLPWWSSEPTAWVSSSPEDPSTALGEASGAVSPLDLPIAAMLRAPHAWPQPSSPAVPSVAAKATGVEGQGQAASIAPATPASATPPDLAEHGGGTSATTGSHHQAEDQSTDPPAPGLGEAGGPGSPQPGQAEHPSAGPRPSEAWNAADLISTEDTPDAEAGVPPTAEHPTSGLQGSEALKLGAQLDTSTLSTPSGGTRVPSSLHPWGALYGHSPGGPLGSLVTPNPIGLGGTWEPGSHMLGGLGPVDTSAETPPTSPDLGAGVSVPDPPPPASTGVQPHPGTEAQGLTRGALGPPSPPPGTATVDEPASAASGESAGPWGASSTLLPVSPGAEAELELAAGGPGLEGFWEEAASGEEPAEEGSHAQEAPTDPCENNPCLHGGSCSANSSTYGCSCAQGFAGENCEIDTEGCDRGWHKFQGHCYRYFAHRRAWEDAERDCRRRAGHLASVHSAGEHRFINSFGQENMWIGLNDRIVERDFQWTDNTGLQYENWRENQPDNFFAGGEDCVVMVAHESGHWSDVPCNYNLPYVCKKGTG
ncbi:PREDICTED: neurocan core protein [Dipodomys ordii]|uniref:Neurocan core protein n=1 Tax=Dipodomys ordii TaxID=10020 RepID=A0A1S3G515_DIPOR|nr:PREDICTED: neurocan core protein [Dipodomys ordii]